ncbi:hypothetical protein AWR36_012380 [Microbulbifer flavimaris]|uniref:Uncharacterized protein n=1 Tax=Microbulbifer flavimaris TaxID=1781068 RepID=A0ABX4HYK3_9GAMM|nr:MULTISPECIES: hypothetical protein [Microbulbifer]KUJ82578.1 hypothetical protein AVO43_12345 [Microbulbifer sp. ZGT114]PCO04787.1 hypothetical protein AWR36_012380 [Microbulbifer flavimaris]
MTLSDQRVLETGLAEARLLAELRGFAIIAGRHCIGCDENTALYVRKIVPRNGFVERISQAAARYTYPGNYRDYQSKALVEKTRFFYGRCYEGQAALLWLSEYRGPVGWNHDTYLILFGEQGLEHRYSKQYRPELFHLGHSECRELPGIEAEIEP